MLNNIELLCSFFISEHIWSISKGHKKWVDQFLFKISTFVRMRQYAKLPTYVLCSLFDTEDTSGGNSAEISQVTQQLDPEWRGIDWKAGSKMEDSVLNSYTFWIMREISAFSMDYFYTFIASVIIAQAN